MDLRNKIIKLLKLFISFSDEGEDKLLLQILTTRGFRRGTYLDIGAYHPIKVSNTYLLYLWGWRGTCVDINNKWKFKLLRPRDKFIYGYVDAEVSYLFPRKLFTSSIPIATNRMKRGWSYKVKYNIPRIDALQFKDYDLLDLDVDGLDFRILKRLLSVHRPKWILVEDKCLDEQLEIHHYLINEGYKRIANTTRNGIYEKEENE